MNARNHTLQEWSLLTFGCVTFLAVSAFVNRSPAKAALPAVEVKVARLRVQQVAVENDKVVVTCMVPSSGWTLHLLPHWEDRPAEGNVASYDAIGVFVGGAGATVMKTVSASIDVPPASVRVKIHGDKPDNVVPAGIRH